MITCNVPDPRRYGAGLPSHPFNVLATEGLKRAVEIALRERRDGEIDAALRAAPARDAYLHLWEALCDVVHARDPDPAAVSMRVFALPLVIVTGSPRPAVLSGTVPDIGAIAALFEQHGALGSMKNFGFSNALCAIEALEAAKPADVHAWTHAPGMNRELAPIPIEITGPGEQVHLRFLVGAGIVGAAEPSFVETASNIGAWGIAVTRALAAQLAQPGVEMLPLPRPPLDLLRAAHAGRCAQLETAFNLFVSNALRRFRRAVGDPAVTISAHDDAELRVGFSSPFDDALREGFRWPLHALDDIGRITAVMTGLLAECRLPAASCIEQVLPALDARGQAWFPDATGSGLLPLAPSRH